ncbi:MAG: glycosyltransferase family 4 protein, partial [Nitrospira sp.]
AGMLRVEELAQLRCPIVWTLHDTWAFTGGCHYVRDCEGYKKHCGYCPQLGSQRKEDYSHSLMRRKDKIFGNLDITVVTPSRWLAEMAKQSSLFADKRIEVIPNGLDTNVFKPIDHLVARQYFNLPQDKAVVLFGAQWVTDPRKGGDLLCDALKQLDQPCTLLLFGEGMLSLQGASHISVRRLGSMADDISLAMVYSAADVFVCPSREDNLPNTVAEALACGTPCAAFAINGLTDMIEHQKNGWLARPFEPGDLAEGIRWLIRYPHHDQLRRAAREKAVLEYSLTKMSNRYTALYEDVLKSVKDRNVVV